MLGAPILSHVQKKMQHFCKKNEALWHGCCTYAAGIIVRNRENHDDIYCGYRVSKMNNDVMNASDR